MIQDYACCRSLVGSTTSVARPIDGRASLDRLTRMLGLSLPVDPRREARRSSSRAYARALAIAGTIACSGSPDRDDAAGSTTVTTPTAGTTTADPDTSTTTSDEVATSVATGALQDLGPCEQYIECVMAANQPITPVLAVYGEGGTCWQEFGEAACWQDCTALRDALGMLHDVEACGGCPLEGEACSGGDACCEGLSCVESIDPLTDEFVHHCRPACEVGGDCASCCCRYEGDGNYCDDAPDACGGPAYCEPGCGSNGAVCHMTTDCCQGSRLGATCGTAPGGEYTRSRLFCETNADCPADSFCDDDAKCY
jgi:hypothetical protein